MLPTNNDSLTSAICRARSEPDCWHWDEDDQHGWCPADTDWQQLCASWRNDSPEPIQTLSVSCVASYIHTRSLVVHGEAYTKMALRILQRREEAPTSGALIVGQSGCGKGCFIWYLLHILLMMDEPVLLACGVYYRLFFKGRVYEPPSRLKDFHHLPHHTESRPLWLLADVIDGDETLLPLDHHLLFPVKTAERHLGHGEVWATTRGAARIGLPLWSEEELVEGFVLHRAYPRFSRELQDAIDGSAPASNRRGTVSWLNQWHPTWRAQTVDDITLSLVKDAIRIVGPVARDVFKFVFNPREHQTYPMALGISYQDIMRSLIGPGGCATDSLFAIRPAHDPRNPHCDAFVCDFKSRRIARDAKRMFFAFPPRTVGCPTADAKHRELFKACWKGQPTSVLAGCLFVNIARHALLGHSDAPLQLSAVFATDDTSSVWRPSSETTLRALSLPLRSAEAYGSSRSPIDEGQCLPARSAQPRSHAYL
ncbi:hypothetical protein L226DRAFT_535188 [Lentinus tigrinus ALCF2SS1-7]|uniref:uncharacterized protein n=1 Tax=Lentinus tigrinus ALCF2SS1-7 TaxID=1328758 RepID=UPI0011663A34|nr:hypothetical protein L226DRAFT_535188 [Lentinus tigrinus ALCF2SS1-7]